MTHFLVFDKKELQDLNNNKPVTIDIAGTEYVVCSEKYFEGAPHIKTNYYGVTTALLGREGTQSLSADVENIPHHYLGKIPMFSLYPNNQEENI